MQVYQVFHTHRHGCSTYLFQCELNIEEGFVEESDLVDDTSVASRIVKLLDIDFEPDRGEFLEVMKISLDNIPTL